MRRWMDVLGPLGLLIIIGSAAWERAGRTLPGKPSLYLIIGAALILMHLVLRWEDLTARLGRRQMKYGANTLVLSLVVLGILGVVNYLVLRHTRRWDLTKNQRFSLSDQTKKIVSGLKDDVTVWYFQRTDRMPAGQDRLKDYQTMSPRLKVEFVDPVARPALAQAHDARGDLPILVVERGDKREKIRNDSEQDITNAILKVTRDTKKTVCFVYGEGEKDLEEGGDHGLSAVKAALGKSQYETQRVLLGREAAVPGSCTVLVVPGPEHDLLPATIEVIRAYVKGGGKLFLMVEPELKQSFPNLTALARDWNIEVGKDVVVDVSPVGQLFGTGPLTPLAGDYPYHEITKDFRVASAFPTARSVRVGSATLPGVTAQNLVETSPASWAETDLTLKEPVQMDPGKDQKGPVPLAAVARITVTATPSPSPEAAASPSPLPSPSASPEASHEGRVAVFGDADFATNSAISFPGNQDLYLNTVAWLAEDVDLIAIRPKEPDDQRMFLTPLQQQNLTLLSLLAVPGVFVVWGVAGWWRRRA